MAEVRVTAVATKDVAERLGVKTYTGPPGLEASIGFYLVYDHIWPSFPGLGRIGGVKELGQHLWPAIRLWRR